MENSFTLANDDIVGWLTSAKWGGQPERERSLPPSPRPLRGYREGARAARSTLRPSCSLVLVRVGFFAWKLFSLRFRVPFKLPTPLNLC
jgi:hypothetical protein